MRGPHPIVPWAIAQMKTVTPSSGKYAGIECQIIGGDGHIVYLQQLTYGDNFIARGTEVPGGDLPTYRFDVDNSLGGDGFVRMLSDQPVPLLKISLASPIFAPLKAEYAAQTAVEFPTIPDPGAGETAFSDALQQAQFAFNQLKSMAGL